jgi:hypothetical protein
MGCDAQIKTKMGVQEAFKWCGLGGGGYSIFMGVRRRNFILLAEKLL